MSASDSSHASAVGFDCALLVAATLATANSNAAAPPRKPNGNSRAMGKLVLVITILLCATHWHSGKATPIPLRVSRCREWRLFPCVRRGELLRWPSLATGRPSEGRGEERMDLAIGRIAVAGNVFIGQSGLPRGRHATPACP